MRDINNFIQNHNTLTLATERNHEVFAAALFYVPVDNCEAVISVAKYEDPGFVLIEAAYLKKKIITSLVKNGPLEMKKMEIFVIFLILMMK